ncbi:Conserved_hypothetical protein [Hexamita inflata]|uniref:Uncharacterized protein n=1 Tax=Hexamita inflata TaxID=28002 RepID=A0AA86NU77_9EUKA|nr:Conserved hypothetical protein [Hexamita inflata]
MKSDNKTPKPKKVVTTLPLNYKKIDRANEIIDFDDDDVQPVNNTPSKLQQQKAPFSKISPIQQTSLTNIQKSAEPVAEKVAMSQSQPSSELEVVQKTASAKPIKTHGIDNFVKKVDQSHVNQRFNNTFTQEIDIFKPQPIRQASQPSFKALLQNGSTHKFVNKPLVQDTEFKTQLTNALVDQGVDFATASQCRRMLIGHFETLLTLQPKPIVTQNGFEVKKDQEIDFEKRKRIERFISTLKHKIDENQTINQEDLGVNRLVASVYIPSRVFFGYAAEPHLTQLSPLNPLFVEDEIDYENETCGFDEVSESTDDEETSESETTSHDNETAPDENAKLQDDIDEVDETGMLAVSGTKKQKREFDFLAKNQKKLPYPVPVLCPEGMSGTKAVMRVFKKATYETEAKCEKTEAKNEKEFEVVEVNVFDGDRKCEKEQEIDGIKIQTGCNIPQYLKPIFWKGDLNVTKECEFMLVAEGEEDELQ